MVALSLHSEEKQLRAVSCPMERPGWQGVDVSSQQPHEWVWKGIPSPWVDPQDDHSSSQRPWETLSQRTQLNHPWPPDHWNGETINVYCLQLLNLGETGYMEIDNWYSNDTLHGSARTVAPETTWGLVMPTLLTVENPSITLQSALRIYGSLAEDSTNQGSCSTVVCI